MYTQPYEFINNSKIISGNRALENIPIELKSYNSHRPFVITSREIAKSSLKKKFIRAFSDSDTTIGCLFDDAPDLTKAPFIDELAELFEKQKCDSIIALGSGPVVNTAKALNSFLSEKKLSIFEKAGEIKLKNRLKPFFLVPVWNSRETDLQDSMIVEGNVLSSEALFPDLICIDKRMTKSGKNDLSLETGLSSLTHAIESSIDSNNPMTDSYSHAAISMLYDTLADVVKGKASKHQLVKFQNGVMFSGIAFSNSETGITHILAESLSEITGKPSGIYMGILLPFVLEFMEEKLGKKDEELLIPLAGIDSYADTPVGNRSSEVRVRIRKLYKEMKGIMPQNLRELGVSQESLTQCAEAAAEDKRWKLTRDDYIKLLDHAHAGISIQG